MPAASSSLRSTPKFSMMPLWTTATDLSADRCGWAFRSVGPPCVAHRVCPMATVAAGSCRSARTFSRFASLPAFFAEVSSPSATTAIPAESYPRYSSRRSPSRTTSRASCGPTYPTIPHIGPRVPAEADHSVRPAPQGGGVATPAVARTSGHTRPSADGGDDLGQPVRDLVGLLLGGRLDHDPHELLGARGAQQHPAGIPELCLDGVHGLGDRVALGDREPVGDRDVDQDLRQPL